MAGTMYAATLSAVAATAAQDVFEIVAPSTAPVTIREIKIGQYTDFGDAASEILSVRVIRGYTASGSGGGSITPSALRQGSAASASTVESNNTTVANTGTAVELLADTWNIQAGFWYRPEEDERIVLSPGERMVVRITAPADSITLNATMVFEEGR